MNKAISLTTSELSKKCRKLFCFVFILAELDKFCRITEIFEKKCEEFENSVVVPKIFTHSLIST